MKVRWIQGVCLALAAAGTQVSANDGHDQIASLGEQARNRRLTELLSQLPEPCVVERNFFRGFDAKGAALWSAGCTNRKAYAIMVLDDAKGSTRIMDCKVLKERGGGDCFTKL